MDGIHDGTLRWADIQEYARFRQVFGNWKLPGYTLVRQDEILLRIHHALVDVPNRSKVMTALDDTLLGSAPTFEESARGITGLTYALMKHWPEDIPKLMYDLLATMWDAKMTADWWQFRWLMPIPKQPDQPSLQAMRQIVRLEVTRKCWTGMIITKIMRVIEENNVLCSAQHGSRRHRSTASANLIFEIALESAWECKTVVYGSSWDISKAFDSVSKDMIRLAWERVGVPPPIVEWLIALDADDHTIVRTEWAVAE